MKKLIAYVMIVVFVVSFVPNQAKAQFDPKVRAVLTMSAYGTIGGALLGTASMAFGYDAINIARGASLGLYAGILFGSYVVLSHLAKVNKWNLGRSDDVYETYPEDALNPIYEGGGGTNYDGGSQRSINLLRFNNNGGEDKYLKMIRKGRPDYLLFYTNFLQWQF